MARVTHGDDSLAIALDGMILRGTVGSTVHGLHLADQDDRDEMAISIPPPARLLGLEGWDHHVERTQPEGVRSRAGRPRPRRLPRCATTSASRCRATRPAAPALRAATCCWRPSSAPSCAPSRRRSFPSGSASRYQGYCGPRRSACSASAASARNRPELIEAHGFDTKYAMHVLRLAVQGRELLLEGALSPAHPRSPPRPIRAVREGQVPFDEVVARIEEAERALVAAHEATALPDEPDVERVDAWLVFGAPAPLGRYLATSAADRAAGARRAARGRGPRARRSAAPRRGRRRRPAAGCRASSRGCDA